MQIPKPTIQMDGNQFHAHSGDDFPEGCNGFGDTEAEAIKNHDDDFRAQQIMAGVPEGQSPTGEQVKGLLEIVTGQKIDEARLANQGQVLADDHGTQLILVDRINVDRTEFALAIRDEAGFTGLRVTKDEWEKMKVTIDAWLSGTPV